MVLHGDSRVLLLTLAENSVDACVTDPPYEIGMEQSAEYHAIATARIAQYTIDAEEPIGLPL